MEEIREVGEIVEVNKFFITIQVQPGGAECHSCAMASLCTGEENGQRKIVVPKEQLDFVPSKGQKVALCFSKVLEYSVLIYLLPVLFFLMAILLAKQVVHIDNELFLFGSGLTGLVLGFFILRFVNNSVSKKGLNIEIKRLGEH